MKIINTNLSDTKSIVLKGIKYANTHNVSSTISIFTVYGAVQTPVIYCDANEIMDEYRIYFIDAIINFYKEFKEFDNNPIESVEIASDMQEFLNRLTDGNKLRLELYE